MEYTEYVCGFLFSNDEEHVAVIEKKKPDWQAGFHNGIGGKIERGEDAYQAMIREFDEEAGIYTEHWNQFATVSGRGWKVTFFRAKSNDVFHCRSLTEETVKVVRVADIVTMKVIPNLKWLIPMALDPNHDLCDAETK